MAENGEPEYSNPLVYDILYRMATQTASHPFDYAKVLIQLGHEPIAPFPTRSIILRPTLGLPNVFEYVKYIKQVDGFRGCYRGWLPRLLSNGVNLTTERYAKNISKKYLSEFKPLCGKDNALTSEKWRRLCYEIVIDISGKTAAIVASQPFQVIMVRTMAQFIGGECKYNGIGNSIVEIYNDQGVLGFFRGLVPRIIGEIVLIVFVRTCTFLAKHFISEKEVRMGGNFAIAVIGSTVSYPFYLVSTCMAVNDCGLAAGNPPQMPIYDNWLQCWRHLRRTDQLSRGSSMFFRTYRGPHLYTTGYHNFVVKRDTHL